MVDDAITLDTKEMIYTQHRLTVQRQKAMFRKFLGSSLQVFILQAYPLISLQYTIFCLFPLFLELNDPNSE